MELIQSTRLQLRTSQTHMIATPASEQLSSAAGLAWLGIKHCSGPASPQTKLWDLAVQERNEHTTSFLFRCYFCACFFFPLWSTCYYFSVFCDFWLNGSLPVCLGFEVFIFLVSWFSMGDYSEAVVCCGYPWHLNQLCRFELHVYEEKQLVLWSAHFIFNLGVVINGIRKLVSLTERELVEYVSKQTKHGRLQQNPAWDPTHKECTCSVA